MPRFLVPPEQLHGNRFTLSGSEANHAIHVHRKKVGDTLDLFDGRDAVFVGRIDSIHGEQVRGSLIESQTATPIPVTLTLFQALIKGPRWDWLIQKASEMGVHRVVPLVTLRTVVKVDKEASAAKVERWNRIAVEASKQCGRHEVMTVERPRILREALVESTPEHLSLIPWEKEMDVTIRQACQGSPAKAASLYIGPEGGWDSDEVHLAQSAGIISVRLGPTLLRAETAGIVSAALLFGELGVY